MQVCFSSGARVKGSKFSVARYSLILSRQACRQFSLKKELPVEDDETEAFSDEELEVCAEDELADCFAEEELEVVLADDELAVDLADDELTVDFTEEELTAFADEELPDFFEDELAAVLAEELDVAATEDELERFFTLEDDFRRSDGTGCSFPSSSYITYVTSLELSEHAEKAKTKDAIAANFTKETVLNKLNIIITLYIIFFNR